MPFPVSRLARYEVRRFRGRVPRAALVFVLLVPLLYAAIYLTANWDPYGKLHRLPVAVVDADQGATVTVDGQERTLDAGGDLVDNLLAADSFDWHQVDAATADTGLAEGRYYLVLEIPADFSADLVSGMGSDPERARLLLHRDDANGFVVGNITNAAENTIARQVDASAEESYFNAVYANLRTIRSGLADATDGSATLGDGLDRAHTGAGKLDRGAGRAERGSRRLQAGAEDLASGLDDAGTAARSLATGLRRIDSGSADLARGAGQVAAGTRELSDTVVPPLKELERVLPKAQRRARAVARQVDAVTDTATGQTGSVASDLDQADHDLATLAEEYPELADDPAYQRLTDRVDSASDHADEIARTAEATAKDVKTVTRAVETADDLTPKVRKARKSVQRLDAGAHQVAAGARSLHRSIGTASDGADDLATGVDQAATGADSLATGAGTLHTGLVTLHRGTGSLDTALGRLADGADQLHDGLATGLARIPAVTQAEQDQAVQVLSSPADVRTSIDHPATYYGRGLAPLFLSIALWVFGISVFLVVRPTTGRVLAGRASPLRLALAGWLPVAGIATVGSWVMIGTVWAALGLDPIHPVLFVATVTLGAVCFSAVAHLLRTALGTVGSSVLLVLLIMQLSSAGGTYPAPLLPGFFASTGKFLPMTYLIDALRVTISGGLGAHLVRDLLLLAAVAVIVLVITVLVVARRQRFRPTDLHPPLTAP